MEYLILQGLRVRPLRGYVCCLGPCGLHGFSFPFETLGVCGWAAATDCFSRLRFCSSLFSGMPLPAFARAVWTGE